MPRFQVMEQAYIYTNLVEIISHRCDGRPLDVSNNTSYVHMMLHVMIEKNSMILIYYSSNTDIQMIFNNYQYAWMKCQSNHAFLPEIYRFSSNYQQLSYENTNNNINVIGKPI